MAIWAGFQSGVTREFVRTLFRIDRFGHMYTQLQRKDEYSIYREIFAFTATIFMYTRSANGQYTYVT